VRNSPAKPARDLIGEVGDAFHAIEGLIREIIFDNSLA
jgi:hypothetical protein